MRFLFFIIFIILVSCETKKSFVRTKFVKPMNYDIPVPSPLSFEIIKDTDFIVTNIRGKAVWAFFESGWLKSSFNQNEKDTYILKLIEVIRSYKKNEKSK